jgi:hypothetical protein
MISVGEGLVRGTLRTLHECGRERDECVVLWSGPLDAPRSVDRALHPRHDAGRGGYRIDRAWMHGLWVQLAEDGRCLRAQVHTHPCDAFHSATDDEYPAVQSAGFVSLVVARFARPPVHLATIHASVLAPEGWRRSTFAREVRCV